MNTLGMLALIILGINFIYVFGTKDGSIGISFLLLVISAILMAMSRGGKFSSRSLDSDDSPESGNEDKNMSNSSYIELRTEKSGDSYYTKIYKGAQILAEGFGKTPEESEGRARCLYEQWYKK